MTDINEIYKSNSDNIKAEDIGNNMWTMTIKSADVKSFDNGAERKLVLAFQEWDKQLPLNITNARAIADLYGHNSNDWIGKQIMLFSMPVKFQDRMVNAVRIRAPMQQNGPQQGGYQQQPQQSAPAPQQSGYVAQQHSPQRPLNQPMQNYAQASGAMSNDGRFAPPPAENPFGGM